MVMTFYVIALGCNPKERLQITKMYPSTKNYPNNIDLFVKHVVKSYNVAHLCIDKLCQQSFPKEDNMNLTNVLLYHYKSHNLWLLLIVIVKSLDVDFKLILIVHMMDNSHPENKLTNQTRSLWRIRSNGEWYKLHPTISFLIIQFHNQN